MSIEAPRGLRLLVVVATIILLLSALIPTSRANAVLAVDVSGIVRVVTTDGLPLENATIEVYAVWRSGMTGTLGGGEFCCGGSTNATGFWVLEPKRIDGVNGGRFDIMAIKEGFRGNIVSVPVVLPPYSTNFSVELNLTRIPVEGKANLMMVKVHMPYPALAASAEILNDGTKEGRENVTFQARNETVCQFGLTIPPGLKRWTPRCRLPPTEAEEVSVFLGEPSPRPLATPTPIPPIAATSTPSPRQPSFELPFALVVLAGAGLLYRRRR